MSLRRFLLMCVALAPSLMAADQPPPRLPLEVFFGGNTIRQPSLSPTGRYLAWLQPVNRRYNLVVLDRQLGKKTRLTDMKEENILSFFWANADRLVFFQQYKGQESTGIYGINVDGTKLAVLRQLNRMRGDEVESQSERSFGIIDTLPDDPRHFLVDINRGSSGLGDPHLLDIYTERLTKVMNNLGKIRDWMTDRRGVIRLAIANDEKEEFASVFYRADERADWVEIERFPVDGPSWTPLGFDGDNRTLYVRSNRGRDTEAIYTYDPNQRKILAEIFADPDYDAGGIIYSRHRKKVTGVTCERERPETIWLDPDVRRLAANLDGALPGAHNTVVSRTEDESLLLIRSASDRDPGTYFLLDTKTFELTRLAAVSDRVDPVQMAPMRPVTYAARDGMKLHGYLTLPVGRVAKGLPLIIHPHGGPYGIRDDWGFNPEIQFLANRGYAVFQINYRGSGGYGRAHLEAGYRQWGLKMQDDLTDGVRWAVAEGIADPTRVAIYGASYGGYAALAGLMLTPDLYACGINYVGVSDIPRLGLLADFSRYEKPFQNFVARRWGHPLKDAAQLKATSPVNLVQHLRAPLLMAYGQYDPRVTHSQFEVLETALKKHQKPYRNIVVANEGHGFNKYENAIAFYGAMEGFLDQHLPAAGSVEIKPARVIDLPAK